MVIISTLYQPLVPSCNTVQHSSSQEGSKELDLYHTHTSAAAALSGTEVLSLPDPALQRRHRYKAHAVFNHTGLLRPMQVLLSQTTLCVLLFSEILHPQALSQGAEVKAEISGSGFVVKVVLCVLAPHSLVQQAWEILRQEVRGSHPLSLLTDFLAQALAL